MDNIRVFQVTGDWAIFRIPVDKKRNPVEVYNQIIEWLLDNCDVFKIFYIEYGEKHAKNQKQKGVYDKIIEVDLLSEVDAIAFKLRWL